VLREYLAAMTRPGELTGTIPLPALLNDVRYFAQWFHVADEGAQVTTHLLALVAELPIAGRQMHDANIVATMQAYQIPRLLTQNTDDFLRFAAFVEVLPLVPPAAPGLTSGP
jgi:predicted nucleic acid-binding protein